MIILARVLLRYRNLLIQIFISRFVVDPFLVFKLDTYFKILFSERKKKLVKKRSLYVNITKTTYHTWRKFAVGSYSGTIFVE